MIDFISRLNKGLSDLSTYIYMYAEESDMDDYSLVMANVDGADFEFNDVFDLDATPEHIVYVVNDWFAQHYYYSRDDQLTEHEIDTAIKALYVKGQFHHG